MIEIISERKYGEPKLKKPKELRNIEQAFSYDLNKKCKCPVFIKDYDVYIKHRDWFSVTIYNGNDYEKWKAQHCKFIYNDCFGAIVLRGEAWMRIKGVLNTDVIVPKLQAIALECIDENTRFNHEADMRMFQDVTIRAWQSVRQRW